MLGTASEDGNAETNEVIKGERLMKQVDMRGKKKEEKFYTRQVWVFASWLPEQWMTWATELKE